jgi:hypothetical protein
MGKRSYFPRRDRDDYCTPLSAVLPLLECLPPRTAFVDPCCGEGDLIAHLTAAGHVLVGRSDAEIDARTARYQIPKDGVFISNPPWRRDLCTRSSSISQIKRRRGF